MQLHLKKNTKYTDIFNNKNHGFSKKKSWFPYVSYSGIFKKSHDFPMSRTLNFQKKSHDFPMSYICSTLISTTISMYYITYIFFQSAKCFCQIQDIYIYMANYLDTSVGAGRQLLIEIWSTFFIEIFDRDFDRNLRHARL